VAQRSPDQDELDRVDRLLVSGLIQLQLISCRTKSFDLV